MCTGDWSSHGAGLVRELSQEVMRASGLTASSERSFFVPFSALTRATYVTSAAANGGNIVATDLMDQDFIEALRDASPVMGLGVRTMTGLVGDVAIPRRSGVASTYYLSTETTAITHRNRLRSGNSLSQEPGKPEQVQPPDPDSGHPWYRGPGPH